MEFRSAELDAPDVLKGGRCLMDVVPIVDMLAAVVHMG